MTNIRVKVLREELIAAVEKKRDACLAEYEKAVKAYNLKKSQWPKKVETQLKDALKVLKERTDEYLETTEFNYPKKYFRPEVSDPPVKPSKPEGAQRLLDMLNMSDQKYVTLSEEQFREYMNSCMR